MNKNETVTKTDEQVLQSLPQIKKDMGGEKKPRGRRGGRPKGSKNKPKFFLPQQEDQQNWAAHAIPADTQPIEVIETGKADDIARPRSSTMYRRWQRSWIRPQFTISRKEAYDVFIKYLRSTGGKNALTEVIVNGSIGIGKLSDAALAKYLEKTNLLSRYPHEVIIK